MPPRRVRRNGLERPYSGAQVATWVLLPFLLSLFYVFITPVVSRAEAAVSGVLYGVLMLLACGAAYKTCSIDPMDPHLKVRSAANDDVSSAPDAGERRGRLPRDQSSCGDRRGETWHG